MDFVAFDMSLTWQTIDVNDEKMKKMSGIKAAITLAAQVEFLALRKRVFSPWAISGVRHGWGSVHHGYACRGACYDQGSRCCVLNCALCVFESLKYYEFIYDKIVTAIYLLDSRPYFYQTFSNMNFDIGFNMFLLFIKWNLEFLNSWILANIKPNKSQLIQQW